MEEFFVNDYVLLHNYLLMVSICGVKRICSCIVISRTSLVLGPCSKYVKRSVETSAILDTRGPYLL